MARGSLRFGLELRCVAVLPVALLGAGCPVGPHGSFTAHTRPAPLPRPLVYVPTCSRTSCVLPRVRSARCEAARGSLASRLRGPGVALGWLQSTHVWNAARLRRAALPTCQRAEAYQQGVPAASCPVAPSPGGYVLRCVLRCVVLRCTTGDRASRVRNGFVLSTWWLERAMTLHGGPHSSSARLAW